MIQFYKPNSSNRGFACSFNYSQKDNVIYAQLIKQVSWNNENKKGSFKGGEKTSIKLGEVEIGGILDSIDVNRGEKGFSIYHDTEKSSKSIIFKPYMKDGNQIGFSFSINQTNKEDGIKTSSFIGFNFAEARLLRQYLQWALEQIFNTNSLNKSENKQSNY